MKIETFEKKIEEASLNGIVIANFEGCINGVEFCLYECGKEKLGDRYLAFLGEGDSSSDCYYDGFEEAIDHFIVNGDTIKNQIDKMEKFESIDYSD